MQFEEFTGHSLQDPAPVALCDRITGILSLTTTYILNSFALYAACLHPELTLPLLEELARQKAKMEARPDDPCMDNVAIFRPRRRIG